MSRRLETEKPRLMAGGYVSPIQRDGCSRCVRGVMQLEKDTGRKRIRCRLHMADVPCGGWCPSFAKVELVRKAA